MAYKYRHPRVDEEVIWFRVKSEIDTTAVNEAVRESWHQRIKSLGLEVGAITWSDKDRYKMYSATTEGKKPMLLPENNRYGIDFLLDCFEEIPDPRKVTPKYTYQRPLKKVIWLKVVSDLVADCGRFKSQINQCGLKIGDVTWVDSDSYQSDTRHIENNRHLINFSVSCFEAISETPSLKLPGQVDLINEDCKKHVDKIDLNKKVNASSTSSDKTAIGNVLDKDLLGWSSYHNPESKLELNKKEKLDRDFTPMKNIN
tara:strand:+ start:4726 stop:5496 length:771 start_codon:yes stop_codon:yes gene_type:complete